jgi:hypothetical protein
MHCMVFPSMAIVRLVSSRRPSIRASSVTSINNALSGDIAKGYHTQGCRTVRVPATVTRLRKLVRSATTGV